MNNELKWKKLSSRYLVKEKWATLRVDTCRMPDGRVVDDYYVLEYSGWVNVVAMTEDDKFILIKQYRHAVSEVIREVPGGCVDPGETPEDAAKRELLEETGYVFDKIEPLSVLYANPATADNKTYAFLATGGKKVQEQHLDENEEIVVELVSPEELKELLYGNQIAHGLHVSAIFYALTKLDLLN